MKHWKRWAAAATLVAVFALGYAPTRTIRANAAVSSVGGHCNGHTDGTILHTAVGHWDGFEPPHIRFFSVTQDLNAQWCHYGLYGYAFATVTWNRTAWVNGCLECIGDKFDTWIDPPVLTYGFTTDQFGGKHEWVKRQITAEFERCVTKIACSTKTVTVWQRVTADGGYTFGGTGI
jgi:hypothetical protein